MPRNTKDNYKSNDRVIHGIDDIETNVIINGGMVINTYQINSIDLQFLLDNNSETIIVDYGSSFFLNCLFVKNKKIILLNNYNQFEEQVNRFLSLNILYNIINNNNKIYLINPNNNEHRITYADIQPFI